MRAQARRVAQEEEEESAFVSMTDMTVGFLFIIMILLAFFASQFQDLKLRAEEASKVDPLEEYLAKVSRTRTDILTQLRDALKVDFPDLQIEISEESDALRFQGEGLFATNQSVLLPGKKPVVERLAERLDEVLACYTRGPNSTFSEDCNPGFVMVEAVLVEGHTDSQGEYFYNRNLSTDRANTTFQTLVVSERNILSHLNLKDQPVMSVAAYGPDRPVRSNDTVDGRATNRRIDLRFIMVSPRDTDGIANIRAALSYLDAEQ